ncbi:LOW QUALITY PROTEIN: exonuclease 3'-5' domain-containing protein 2 [Rhagoletis pomonella]|uniref:LOW QUALITY PROTEIN: exonuclease 3'-5' domain-containing protein 2 n=1 Tax=Rhagoletis pomonella TaxID=28610 RepID=UPI00177B5BF9|nr:LOW QUALITY PROTEIN: exonuclease 3'-5' domain-containing protein 2 [Rhagoletis pomonella]
MGDIQKRSLMTAKTAFLATAGVGLLCILVRQRARILSRIRNFRDPLAKKQVTVIETPDECQRVLATLKSHCHDYKVLGFDCEWVTVGGKRRPVALLQLSSQKGLCALFRLCNLQQIPKDLRDLLEDDKVIKVGVGTQEDAHKLAYDYGVGVASTLDLRYLAALVNQKPEGLAKMAKSLLDVHLDKHWRLSCSDWEAKVLNEKQLQYAANDALVAVKIFEKLAMQLDPKPFWNLNKINFSDVQERLQPFYDIRFKEGLLNNLTHTDRRNVTMSAGKKAKQKQMQTRSISTRSRALYDNCNLQAPDGELLCTIDSKKAQWYVDQNLGDQVGNNPLTVRLNFEPSGRAVGDVGRYYQTPKENRCVVCGRIDPLSRKNVVPREYRKHFPVVMKSHTSHDVLLLCPQCHQLSNIYDLKMRMKLAEQCNAPFTKEETAVKYIELPELKQVKSAARALLQSQNEIPVERRKKILGILLHHYQKEKLTDELIKEAANIDTTRSNETYCQHGEKVVLLYQTQFGGLCELEKLWRQHFLTTMKPKFLPELWNVNHNANRLEIRAQEGRIDKEDLIVAGLDKILVAESVAKS